MLYVYTYTKISGHLIFSKHDIGLYKTAKTHSAEEYTLCNARQKQLYTSVIINAITRRSLFTFRGDLNNCVTRNHFTNVIFAFSTSKRHR